MLIKTSLFTPVLKGLTKHIYKVQDMIDERFNDVASVECIALSPLLLGLNSFCGMY